LIDSESEALFDTAAIRPKPSADRAKLTGTIIHGDAARSMQQMDDGIFQCVVTSPPYWGLRDYGIPDQIGAEPTVDEYIERLVKLFAHVRRTLRDDGTMWLNIGDGFTSGGRTWRQSDKKLPARGMDYRPSTPEGLKPKDLIGIPWRLAFALQADGWYLRTDIVWNKPNGNPESVKDRPVRTHEFLFLLTKRERYLYNYDAVKEPSRDGKTLKARRSVWNIYTEPFPEAHFATFPAALVEPCILAGSHPDSLVLDPFFGSGTVGQVAHNLGRNFVGLELNSEYLEIALRRISSRCQGFTPEVRSAW
jgi:site-specific DNA-methyltransferase (adenine-specific)/site-specific DNA-methyltransferase (cytosine-N4-specific)